MRRLTTTISKNLAEWRFIPLKQPSPIRLNAEFTPSCEFRLGFVGTIRAMAMAIRCDFCAINGEAKTSAGAVLILGGLLLLIAP
jgi:hypothetical protein